MSLAKYISEFRKLLYICDFREEIHMNLVKFHNKLRPKFKQFVLINQSNNVDDIYQVSLEHEYWLKDNP